MSRPVLSGCFEPAAEEALRAEPDLETDEVTAISIAISLKRIADQLDGTTTGVPLATAIEQAIGTGMFHGFQNLKR